jgi:hypothetical protein
MSDPFIGSGSPLDETGLDAVLSRLGVTASALWAVLQVETTGCGFLPNRKPKILFERHVFSRLTGHAFDATHPGISNPVAGGYGPPGDGQYVRLNEAIALNRSAALASASWGLGQVMGYHATDLGYPDVETMVRTMVGGESAQLEAMARFIETAGLASALQTRDWVRFAARYNGPDYQLNKYDTRLSTAFAALEQGGAPDLNVRAGQVFLTYLGFDPHGIDGLMGRLTRAAMNDFQQQRGLPITQFFDATTLSALRTAVN